MAAVSTYLKQKWAVLFSNPFTSLHLINASTFRLRGEKIVWLPVSSVPSGTLRCNVTRCTADYYYCRLQSAFAWSAEQPSLNHITKSGLNENCAA